MSVRHQQIEPTVVIHIKEADAPTKKTRVHSETARVGAVFEIPVAEIRIKRIGIAGEVSLHNVEFAVAIIVADGNTHARLRLCLSRKRRASLDGDIAKRSVLLIQIKGCRRRIVSDVNIRPAVVVQIRSSDAQSIRADCGPHAALLAHVLKRSIALVVIKKVLSAGQSGRSAGHEDSLVSAGSILRQRCSLQVEVDIVCDEQVQLSIPVVVNKCAAAVPTDLGARLNQAGFFRDLSKRSIAIVAVEGVLAVVGHEQVIEAVVVVVADAASLAPSGLVLQSRTDRHVSKCSVPIVLEEPAMRFLPRGKPVQPPTVHQEEIRPPIMIVVIESQTASSRLEKVLVMEYAAIDRLAREAGLRSHLNEADAEGCTLNGRFRAGWWRRRPRVIAALLRPDLRSLRRRLLLRGFGKGNNVGKRQHERRAAQR